MIDIIIFSKDRACQLEFLFRSLPEKFKKSVSHIRVLYKASNEKYMDGYKKLYPTLAHLNHCLFHLENDFRKNLIDIYNEDEGSHVMFLTDDDVFVSDFKLEEGDSKFDCISLKLHPGIKKSYSMRTEIGPPDYILYDNGMAIWPIGKGTGEWNYPMSVDGHIFHRHVIGKRIVRLNYTDPNTFENEMAKWPISGMMACPDRPVLINLPLNKVQSTYDNRSGKYSAEEINRQFLKDNAISMETLKGLKFEAPHEEAEIIWEKDV